MELTIIAPALLRRLFIIVTLYTCGFSFSTRKSEPVNLSESRLAFRQLVAKLCFPPPSSLSVGTRQKFAKGPDSSNSSFLYIKEDIRAAFLLKLTEKFCPLIVIPFPRVSDKRNAGLRV